jgi:chromosome segregation ATPase
MGGVLFLQHHIQTFKKQPIKKHNAEVYKMKKKLSALFVLSVFLLSMIPLAFAETGSGSSARPVAVATHYRAGSGEPGSNESPAQMTVREKLRQRFNETNKTMLKQRIQQHVMAKRMITKEKLDAAKDRYKLAKQHYLTAKKAYLGQKGNFTKAKEAYKNCKDDDSEECGKKRKQLKQNAKPHLLKAADLVLKELEKMKERVQASEDLSDEEVARIVAEIEQTISDVEDAKDTIENLDENSTNDEYNAAAKTIRDAWKKARMKLKKHAGRLVNARLGNIILRTEKLEKRLYNARDKLEEKGMDVSTLDEKLDEFSDKLDTAADKYNEARSKWSDANTPGEVDDVAKDVHALLGEAKAALGKS